MSRKLTIALLCWLVLIGQSYSQDVFVPRELKAVAVKKEVPEPAVKRAEPVTPSVVKERPVKEPTSSVATAKTPTPKTESSTAKAEKAPVKEKPADATKAQTVKVEPEKAKAEKSVAVKEKAVAAAAKDPRPTVTAAKKPAVKPEVATEKAQKPAAPKDEVKVEAVTAKTEKAPPPKDQAASVATAKKPTLKTESATAKSEKAAVKDDSVSVPTTKTVTAKSEKPAKEELPTITVAKTQTVKAEPPMPKTERAAKEPGPALTTAKNQTPKPDVVAAKTKAPQKEEAAPPAIAKTPLIRPEPISAPPLKEPSVTLPVVSSSMQSAFTKIADGFDFPVGKPEAEGYYKARGFRAGGHVGEDWDGIGGGDTDLKDPIYSIGDGIVVFARDVHLGWGNVVIVRHAYRENGTVKYVDALYGHLHTMLVSRGQKVSRGQQIATMGTAHGQYDAHLHFEIRKNLEIGMSRSKFEKNFSNYYDPSQFVASHRRLSGGGSNYRVAMNTFTYDWMYRFDKARDFSARKRSTSQSSAALKRALTSTTR
jgi:murein DD-endopeptidase MepM/ murein hydrolase activator NlpD